MIHRRGQAPPNSPSGGRGLLTGYLTIPWRPRRRPAPDEHPRLSVPHAASPSSTTASAGPRPTWPKPGWSRRSEGASTSLPTAVAPSSRRSRRGSMWLTWRGSPSSKSSAGRLRTRLRASRTCRRAMPAPTPSLCRLPRRRPRNQWTPPITTSGAQSRRSYWRPSGVLRSERLMVELLVKMGTAGPSGMPARPSVAAEMTVALVLLLLSAPLPG
jgi:hypothetical protein